VTGVQTCALPISHLAVNPGFGKHLNTGTLSIYNIPHRDIHALGA
jgi:hypothetical protein